MPNYREMKKIKYSIIIPHKNCPGLLKRCLDSIPIREDIQIIVIDDNSSKDKKPSIDRLDVELILLNAEQSKGAGRARNVGLEHAKGEWLLFADADDCFTDNLPMFLSKRSNDNIHDMVILNARGVDKEENSVSLRQNVYINNWLNKRFYSEKVIRYGLWAPWNRMVRLSLVNKHKLEFEEVPIGNDVVFGLECSKYAEKIDVEPDIIYNYYLPSGRSVTDSYRRKLSNIEVAINHFIFRSQLYKEVGYVFKPCHILYVCSFKTEMGLFNFVKEYYSLLRKKNYSLVNDIYYLFVYYIGRLFRIV